MARILLLRFFSCPFISSISIIIFPLHTFYKILQSKIHLSVSPYSPHHPICIIRCPFLCSKFLLPLLPLTPVNASTSSTSSLFELVHQFLLFPIESSGGSMFQNSNLFSVLSHAPFLPYLSPRPQLLISNLIPFI